MIWDTHAHLDDPVYTEDFAEVAGRIQSAEISRVTNVGCDLPSSERSVQLLKTTSLFMPPLAYTRTVPREPPMKPGLSSYS